MLSGLLATALLAPAQPPAPAATPVAPPPPVAASPPSIDPTPAGVCPADGMAGGYSFNTTHSGPAWTFWGGADYRLYWVKPAPSPGVLAVANGQPFGGETEFGRVNGVGFDAGTWLNDRHTVGLVGSGFLFEQKSRTAAVSGPGLVVRPFTNALLAQPAAFAVSDPASGITGGLATDQGLRLSGFDVSGINNLANCCDWSADYLFGFRYLDLDEYLTVTQASAVPRSVGLPFLGNRLNADTGLTLTDRFRTRNQFYGGQMGLRGEYHSGGFFVGAAGKLGIGNVHQRVDIDGRTDLTGRPGVPGGLLALQGANTGSFTTNRFGVLVDIGLTTGYQFAAWGRAKVGYDFLYLNDVARPGQQVDSVVNTRFVPTSRDFSGVSGLVSPIVTRRTDDFFAHGLRFGVELLY